MYEQILRFHKMEDKKPEHGQAVLIEIKTEYRKSMNNLRYVIGDWNEGENVFELPDYYTPYYLRPEWVAGWMDNKGKEEGHHGG